MCAKEAAASKFGAICLVALQRCLETFDDVDIVGGTETVALLPTTPNDAMMTDAAAASTQIGSNYGAIVRLVLQELMNNDPTMTVKICSFICSLSLNNIF